MKQQLILIGIILLILIGSASRVRAEEASSEPPACNEENKMDGAELTAIGAAIPAAPEQTEQGKVSYAVEGVFRLQEYHFGEGLQRCSYKVFAPGLRFDIVNRVFLDQSGHEVKTSGSPYVIVKLWPFKAKTHVRSQSGAYYVDIADDQKLFVIPESIFNQAVLNGFISKRRRLNGFVDHLALGASLSAPFKLRPRINGVQRRNREITTDVSLGGYLGLKLQVGDKDPVYVNGVVSAGLTLLHIDDEAAPEASARESNTVPGFTWAAGVILEIKNVQLGVLYGRDYASGTRGDSWAYNTKGWWSLSIGFTFLKKDGS